MFVRTMLRQGILTKAFRFYLLIFSEIPLRPWRLLPLQSMKFFAARDDFMGLHLQNRFSVPSFLCGPLWSPFDF